MKKRTSKFSVSSDSSTSTRGMHLQTNRLCFVFTCLTPGLSNSGAKSLLNFALIQRPELGFCGKDSRRGLTHVYNSRCFKLCFKHEEVRENHIFTAISVAQRTKVINLHNLQVAFRTVWFAQHVKNLFELASGFFCGNKAAKMLVAACVPCSLRREK
jgi:hypothetical protein